MASFVRQRRIAAMWFAAILITTTLRMSIVDGADTKDEIVDATVGADGSTTISDMFESCQTQDDALVFVKSILDAETDFLPEHIELSMKRGWWDAAKEMVQSMKTKGRDVSIVVRQTASAIRRQADELVQSLTRKDLLQTVAPAFQWAQSGDYLHINVKFAHRLDSPGALHVTDENITLTNSSLYFSGISVHSNQKRKYELDFDFLHEVDPENSSWSSASVGRLTFTIKKMDAPSVWSRLTNSKAKVPNMHTWWELKEKYQEELTRIADDKEKETKTENVTDTDVAAVNSNESVTETQESTNPSSSENATEVPNPPASASSPETDAEDEEKEKKEQAMKEKLKQLEQDFKKKRKAIDVELKRRKKAAEEAMKEKDKNFDEAKKKLKEEYESEVKKIESELNSRRNELEEQYKDTRFRIQTGEEISPPANDQKASDTDAAGSSWFSNIF
eukprot:GILK01003007.1.p1 GENE.GILK01003007.1~~GILK01003007.1.p1  ORF type:complete len:475 (-),score=115.67 GILK01003007.1:123-1466(-)